MEASGPVTPEPPEALETRSLLDKMEGKV